MVIELVTKVITKLVTEELALLLMKLRLLKCSKRMV